MGTALEAGNDQNAPSGQEEADLVGYEETIGRGLGSFVEVGLALQRIRDGRQYRSGYPTFEEYCRRRWQMGRAHANRYIDGARVVGLLSPIGDIPANESQARPLTRIRTAEGDLDKRMIKRVCQQIVADAPACPDGGKQVTAKVVESQVAPLVQRRQRRRRKRQAIADGFPSGIPLAKNAFRPVRGYSKIIPKVTLTLPRRTPAAAVVSLTRHFDRAYIEAVVTGLQRFLADGHVEPLFTPPPSESEAGEPASDAATQQSVSNPE